MIVKEPMGIQEETVPSFSFEALYLHIPFCARRCAYCDFATESVDRTDPRVQMILDAYVDQLIIAIRRASQSRLLTGVRTIYIGGGTPTVLGSALLVKLVYTLSLFIDFSLVSEFTVEANPESFSPGLARDLYALGVTRFSFGIQSFNNQTLGLLGRIHTAEEASTAIRVAQERTDDISIDLICGVPGQSLSSWEADVREAVASDVPHISIYPLTVEEGTAFAHLVDIGRLAMPDEDMQADCMERAARILAEAGFVRYEVASYAKLGYMSKHNYAYWHGVPYLGLGRGAAGMFPAEAYPWVVSAQVLPGLAEAVMGVTTARVRYTTDVDGGSQIELLTQTETCAEDLMLAMRCTEGVSAVQTEKASQLLPRFLATVQQLQDDGLLVQEYLDAQKDGELDGMRILPTTKGWLMGNELFGALWDCRE
jgi:oxygen-independent coproporphyrinogen III oxidase